MDDDQRIAMAAKTEGYGEKGSPSKGIVIVLILLLVVIVGLLGAGIYFLSQPGAPTETIRDVIVIIVAFEFMIVGLAALILLVQLARLVNLIQNELRPIIDSASEAANTLRGTAQFLSKNLVSPVINVNSAMAAVRKGLELLNFRRRK